MTSGMTDGLWALTEKEKQTLRLMVRGHDAKSIARSLDLSVHTINERLRDARRKMAVSSSREAARLLLEAEGAPEASTPDFLGDRLLGADAAPVEADQDEAPVVGVGPADRRRPILPGVLLMTFVLGLLALAALPDAAPTPQSAPAAAQARNVEVVDAARQWLALIDQDKWAESYRGTGSAFQKLNTVQVWTEVSQTMRGRFGALQSRSLLSQEELPAPPHGYEVVKFRASYANQAQAIETVTLDRENGAWRVVGVTIE
ncbi:helix-turn-helix domain-containing protein [Sphingobium sp. DN12]|uniref:helix-turn-helix domain-containing protein n=1 Tax=Sphingobium sp. DN12 TaxID=3378073 RepID=UPI003DA61D22